METTLTELPVSRSSGEAKRRWFQSSYFDLVVWLTDEDAISGFQLCYDRGPHEHALVWSSQTGFSHYRVDDGEADPLKNQSPVLAMDGAFPAAETLRRFGDEAGGIDPAIRNFVVERINSLAQAQQGHE